MSVKSLEVTITALLFLSITSSFQSTKIKREFYQLTVYHYKNESQEKMLDIYLEKALIPALHKINFKNIGCFKAQANDTSTDKILYVLINASSINKLTDISLNLEKDENYQNSGSEYLNAAYDNPPYTRKECIYLKAFSGFPALKTPPFNNERKERVYELRSYESATEKLHANKVSMFNTGDEIGLFNRLNFNASFYGEVISGSKMPNLMYMTCHENRPKRDANWKAFTTDPYWKKLSSMPEYQHNVSHIDISFLYPTSYSDF